MINYDLKEAIGIYSFWDVYNIQEETERPTKAEEGVIKHIFETRISGTINCEVSRGGKRF